jgi:hypothetical protein
MLSQLKARANALLGQAHQDIASYVVELEHAVQANRWLAITAAILGLAVGWMAGHLGWLIKHP